MSITERLYYNDSHLAEFDAEVVAVAPVEGGRTAVTLDRTAFYPTGGGQPSDTGQLGEARVVECVDEEEAGVRHILEGASLAVGARVRGRVDWARRLDHMQQHTGQHIFSQAFVALYGAQTRSFRMLERVSEIDVDLPDPSDERIARATELANEVIWQNRPIQIRQVTSEEAAALPLRKDSQRAGELRIIEIEDFDLSPCGGTHAKRTGEVGIIAVRSWERAKGLTRVEFVAGNRAYADYRQANATARAVAALFSVGREEAVASVARLQEEHKQLLRRARALEELAARVEAEELLSQAVTQSDGASHEVAGRAHEDGGGAHRVERVADGVTRVARIVSHVFEGRDAESLKRLASALVAHPGTIALLASREAGDETRLVFARAADASGDMNALMREACGRMNGRGGGRPELAQGGGRAGAAQLADIMQAAVASIPKI